MSRHLGLAEGVHALSKNSDDGEGQTAQLDRLAQRGLLRAVELLGQILRDDADFVVGLRILLVEETSGEHDQVAHLQVLGIHTHDLKVAFLAVPDGNALVQRNHRRRGGDAGNLLLHRQHVVDGERVVAGVGDALSAAFVLRVDQVGADRLNLIENVLLPGEADGRHQDQRRGADHHA